MIAPAPSEVPVVLEEWVCQFCFPRVPYAGTRVCPCCGSDKYQAPRASYEAAGGIYGAVCEGLAALGDFMFMLGDFHAQPSAAHTSRSRREYVAP